MVIQNELLQVTSITELKKYAEGTIVRLPDFGPEQPFVARLKRPSMMGLVKGGQIPKQLLVTANELFMNRGKKLNTKDTEMMSEMFGLFETICEATFVEPTYKQLKDSGIELTDDQLMFVFNYSQQGVKALQPFR